MSKNRALRVAPRHIQATVCLAVLLTFVTATPAFAFDEAASAIIQQTCSAFKVAKNVLITAAVLAVIVGLAPMLWGQVKVKWIVSSLVACTLFSVIPQMVVAFASGAQGCPS